MFGLSLSEKTEKVIEELFFYQITPPKRLTFLEIVREGKASQMNEYSIAFMFMMVMMNSTVFAGEEYNPNEHRDEKEKLEVIDFIKTISSIILENIHLANSPETEIKAMLSEVLKNAEISDVDVVDEDIVDEDTNEPLVKLMDGLEIYRNFFSIAKLFVTSTEGYKYISEYQCKFIFGLQFLGVADCIGQSLEADDVTVMAAFAAKTADKGQEDALFDWDAEEAGNMFRTMIEVQQEDWAMQIMINGGRSVSEMASEKEDKNYLPLLKVFDDVDLMKEASTKIIP